MNKLVSNIDMCKPGHPSSANGVRRRAASGLLWSLLLVALCGATSPAVAQECVAYGPKTVTMTEGKPVTVSDSFTASVLPGTYTVIVQNGDASGTRRVSSGEVRVAGIEVVKESDFKQSVAQITKSVTVPATVPRVGTLYQISVDVKLKGGDGKNSAQPPYVIVRIVRQVTETDGPEITITQPQQGSITDASSITVAGTAVDASGVKTLTVNGNAVQLAGNAFSAQVALTPGSNAINITAADCAGSTTTKTLTVVRDAAPPTLTILSPTGGLTKTPSVEVRGTVTDDAGISKVTVNDRPAVLAGNNFALSIPLVEGANSIAVVATDVAGKRATAAATIRLDTVAPVITIAAPTPNQVAGSSPLTVSGTATDASGVVSLTINGAATPIAGGAFNAQVALTPGSNTIKIEATDFAGGNTSTRTINALLDAAAPQVSVTTPTGNLLTNAPTLQVRGTATDDSSVSSVTVNGQPAILNGGEFSRTITLAEGANTITVVATDAAGKQSTATAAATLDTTPPQITITAPRPGTRVTQPSIDVVGEAGDANGIASVKINGNAVALVGNRFTQSVGLQVGESTITAVATDGAGNTATANSLVSRAELTPLTISITTPAPQSLVSTRFVNVTGLVDTKATSVKVNGVTAAVIGGAFTAENVPLHEGVNLLTATANKGANGADGVGSASISVILDTSSPTVRIDAPGDGAILTASTVTVTGMVNDVVSGTVNAEQATITVNGQPATISNRTFVATDLPLVRGANVLTAIARDPAGNESRHQITVNVRDTAGQQRLVVVSGDKQTGVIGTMLAQPLAVQLLDANGNPMPNRPVNFSVRRSDGIMRAAPQEGQEITVMSDAEGRASAQFQLGTRSGVGNNVVGVTSSGFTGEAIFSHSATVGAPVRINGAMVMGETSMGIVGKPLPMPFDVIVTDAGGNPVADVPVTFKVEQGGGRIEGQTTFVENTNSDGKASVLPVLGEQEGIVNNVFSASFAPAGSTPGAETNPSAYLKASGLVQGAASDTRVSGVVLDNQNRPIPHAHAKIVGRDDLFAYTNAQGQFTIPNAPVGTVTLIVDGSTTTRPEKFPFLAFMLMNVAGQDNTVGMPIFIPFLDTEGTKIVGGDEDVVLTMKGVPGVAFTVFANSVKKPDGTKYVGPMSLTQVHADKVPMPPPNGTSPKVVWTLQPAGLHFDKPIQVQLPNTDGLTPGQVIEVFSFDHALEQFVSGGMARVSPDGSVLVSDPGFGIHVSGWGAPAPPPPSPTCAANCDDKNPCTADSCIRSVCVHRPVNEGGKCDDGSGCGVAACRSGVCKFSSKEADGKSCDDKKFCTDDDVCKDGACKGDEVKFGEVEVGLQEWNFTELVRVLREGVKPLEAASGCDFGGVEVGGSIGLSTKKECCEEQKVREARSTEAKGSVSLGLASVKCPIPGAGFNFLNGAARFGVFLTAGFKGSITASGGKNGCTNKPTLTASGSLNLTGGLSLEATAISDKVISVAGGGSVSGGVTVSCSSGGKGSVVASFGKPQLSGKVVLAGFIEKNVSYTFPYSLDFGPGEIVCPLP